MTLTNGISPAAPPAQTGAQTRPVIAVPEAKEGPPLCKRKQTFWPLPPACIVARDLTLPPAGARVTVAGLVLVRQRPGTAKGVIFITLEDETGTCNVVVWSKIYERFRRAVIAGRLLRVTGRLQKEAGVIHLVAERIEDISHMLDSLVRHHELCRAGDQPETTQG